MDGDALDRLARQRFEYETAGLDVAETDADPLAQWRLWYSEAVDAGCTEPHAFALATLDADGWPQARNILLRSAEAEGFSFFTNYQSAKGVEMAACGKVSMLFSWLQLHRQVRIVGTVERLPDSESDEYFASRPRGSQIGAWASRQSEVIPDRQWLEDRAAQLTATFGDGAVPRPAFWGGWLVRPRRYEFWQGRPSRLHDRVCYTPTAADGGWTRDRLSP